MKIWKWEERQFGNNNKGEGAMRAKGASLAVTVLILLVLLEARERLASPRKFKNQVPLLSLRVCENLLLERIPYQKVGFF